MSTSTDQVASVANAGRSYERYAWVSLFAFFIIIFLRGIIPAIFGGGSQASSGLKTLTGFTWDQISTQYPGFATFITGVTREVGLGFVGYALLGMAITGRSYRRCERWAWYTLWFAPVFVLSLMALVLTNAEGGGTYPANSGLLTLDIILLALTLIGLILPIRRFFPKSPTDST